MLPFWVHFGSIVTLFGTLGPPWVRFFAFRGALARTFAHTARASPILREFGCPKGGQKKVGGEGGDPCGREGKLHFAPLNDAPVWVLAHSAISDACNACKKATDLSQLPFKMWL